jgi:hypothetical protein
VKGIWFAYFSDAAIKLEGGKNHIIAGNAFSAILLTPSNNNAIRVTGNSGGAHIGGSGDLGSSNMIDYSSGVGVYLDNASGGSVLLNNIIGFQSDGVGNGGNGQDGVFVGNSPNNVIQFNFIGYNHGSGVSITGAGSSGNAVQYNTIGMSVTSSTAGNTGSGVLVTLGAKNTTIGAPLSPTSPNARWGGNTIYNNGSPGVFITLGAGSGNSVLDNEFSANGNLDIDLNISGPSANQTTNPAAGPNGLQNYPELTSAERDASSGLETVKGTLKSAPNTTYRMDIYWGWSCLGNGRGQAYLPIESTYVTTGSLGTVSFTTSVAFSLGAIPVGGISATATAPDGSTSEIGNCVSETMVNDTIFKNGFE